MHDKYTFREYSPLFPELFSQERRRLLTALHTSTACIEHVGSTAVPGLGGKGIIDLALCVEATDLSKAHRALLELGYQHHESASTPERGFYRIDLPDPEVGVRRFHVHLLCHGSSEFRQLIRFRNLLRADPAVRQKYDALKQDASRRCGQDGALYRHEKEPFFQQALSPSCEGMVFVVYGTPGSGKRAALQEWRSHLPTGCRLLRSCDLPHPSGVEEKWAWREVLMEKGFSSGHLLLDVEGSPQGIREACELCGVCCHVLLFDCAEPEQKRRLEQHHLTQEEQAAMFATTRELREEAGRHKDTILHTTHLTQAQIQQLFDAWIQEHRDLRRDLPIEVVRELICSQFPEYAPLVLEEVVPGGWDHRTFRLGEQKMVRLPSAERYVAQVTTEQRWLPYLAAHLPLSIPQPLAMGAPSQNYPWPWSVYGWIEGDRADAVELHDDALTTIAEQLADFLLTLQSIDPAHGPRPGPHNFYRGGSLSVYDASVQSSLGILEHEVDVPACRALWKRALRSTWRTPAVWVHGDFAPGNILLQRGRVVGVIDFGGLAVGDPACDLVIAWTLLEGASREHFRSLLPLDEATWERAQGWALWKALITLSAQPSRKDSTGQKLRRHIHELTS